MKQTILLFSLLILATTACRHKNDTQSKAAITIKMDGELEAIEDSVKKGNALALQSQFKRVVYPKGQTQAVNQGIGIDAADDPAIWYNNDKPEESRIIGTDKQAGLGLYNLSGELVHFTPAGRVNNVDLRYDFPIGDRKLAIAAATERNLNAIMLFEVNADSLRLLSEPTQLDSTLIDDAYGCCMYYSKIKDAYYAFVCGKNGTLQQWRLIEDKGQVKLELMRNIQFSSQCEGMVADDEEGILYVAEEGKAIWKMSAEEDASDDKTMLNYSDSLNVHIAYDLEGLDIFYSGNNKGYLIASVQGNFSYAIFEKQGNNKYLGNFVIKSGATIDGAEETDGLAVCNLNLGSQFPNGLLVVQDGFNTENGKDQPQNFKLVDWAEIAKQYDTELCIAPEYKWWKQ
ncbi:phytase [Carboxylicivirga sp. N1Y90]|uniref:phytase n=1 Tax=Carboxylicivirga fragile TaxID=3417571 RepID=UPI003D3409E7|nr:phytase [Marinilabiliaceae bacterium N1Y90]